MPMFRILLATVWCTFLDIQARARLLRAAPHPRQNLSLHTAPARAEPLEHALTEHALVAAAGKTLSNTSTRISARLGNAQNAYEDWVQWLLPQIPVLSVDPLTLVLQNQLALGISQANGGLWLEFGVFSGMTINLMASQSPGVVHGFDSFEGLPEDWHIGTVPGAPANSRTIVKETFDRKGTLPPVHGNVMLHKGWFDKTLPAFLEKLPEVGTPGSAVSLLHIDCDLYSSTKLVLESLASRIVPGTVIVFDELVNFPEYREHELKALYEFVAKHGRQFAPIGCMCQIDPNGVQYEGDGSCLATAVRITA